MLRQRLPIILLMYSAGSKSSSSRFVCVFMCITQVACINTNTALGVSTHSVHVNAIGVGPGMLEILLQPLAQRIGDLVEADELSDPQHLGVVPSRPRVQTLDDGRNIPKDTGVHQCYGFERRREGETPGAAKRGENIGRLKQRPLKGQQKFEKHVTRKGPKLQHSFHCSSRYGGLFNATSEK